MVKVIAKMTGFYGGRVREIGDEFEVINEEWEDEARRPKWVELASGEQETLDAQGGAESESKPKKRKDKAEAGGEAQAQAEGQTVA